MPGPGIAIVGASLGGLRAAEQLRAAGWEGPVTVYGDENHLPYNRPPLSKEVLAGRAAPHTTELRRRDSTGDVRWRLRRRVVSADVTARTLTLADGSVERFEGLVAATGIRPRQLPLANGDGAPVRHVLRTRDDSERLRDALARGGRVVVVGAGFIGCETAATARTLGCEVTVVAPEEQPMEGPLGNGLGAVLRRRHEAEGVCFALGRTVARFGPDGVLLDDGTLLGADTVVEAVGSLPNTEWLRGNDALDLSDGVLCDGQLRAGGLPHVVAVGDVARFPNARYDTRARRVEHWSVPGETARHAARTLLAGLAGEEPTAAPFAPLASFWSDQFGMRVQSFGAPGQARSAELLEGDPHCAETPLVVGYRTGERLLGVVALGGAGASSAAGRYRSALTTGSAGEVGAAGAGVTAPPPAAP
ncbi:NAD(P)/FAD-dependent oxidoreductase [Streptomyces sp. NPDC048172]|uniref:NAD(P)/FAD-dependent oxidoreductase n=1 Tax=Streptomyces sp. NPDC048172 TaxID=3365505 RepID=UPI003715D01E